MSQINCTPPHGQNDLVLAMSKLGNAAERRVIMIQQLSRSSPAIIDDQFIAEFHNIVEKPVVFSSKGEEIRPWCRDRYIKSLK